MPEPIDAAAVDWKAAWEAIKAEKARIDNKTSTLSRADRKELVRQYNIIIKYEEKIQ